MRISNKLIALCFSGVLLSCGPDGDTSTVSSDREIYAQYHAAEPISAQAAAAQMEKLCAEKFPNGEATKAALQAANYRAVRKGATWIHPTEAISVTSMTSPTGRGYGCSMSFYSKASPKEVRDAFAKSAKKYIANGNVFSVWVVPNLDPESSVPLVNGNRVVPDAQFASVPRSEKYSYISLLTEK